MASEADTHSRIRDVFADAGVSGRLHARRTNQGGPEIGVGADEPVVLASVFKVTVALAYARQVVGGVLDPSEVVAVPSTYRTGGIGTSGCLDEPRLSLRDLAGLMLTLSDNAATDVIVDRVGLGAIRTVIDDLGLTQTSIDGHCDALFSTFHEDLGVDRHLGLEALVGAWHDAPDTYLRALDPRASLHRSTPRDITLQLSCIWNDDIVAPAACKIVRDTMADQVWPHRLASGFPDDVAVAGKTGTLSGVVRNEAGVVTYPDGLSYAVAVFLRSETPRERHPAADRAIGESARLAVDHLRES